MIMKCTQLKLGPSSQSKIEDIPIIKFRITHKQIESAIHETKEIFERNECSMNANQ